MASLHTEAHRVGYSNAHTHIADGSDDGTSPPKFKGGLGGQNTITAMRLCKLQVARVSHRPPQPYGFVGNKECV